MINYFLKLEPDPNTANRNLKLSGSHRKVRAVEDRQPYPNHPERYDSFQLLHRYSLTGRCYWEVKWGGWVEIGVTHKEVRKTGNNTESHLGRNCHSWSLKCSNGGYSVWHDNRETTIPLPPSSDTVAVYVDCPAGILSFYRVSSGSVIHLHTFNTSFTEPLFPGFRFCSLDSSVTLCEL
uniref:B30.2/SPRY domain-containing protein n=1 Tax=Stegastes partitus TaxID=144197 RepID=A0A3B5ABB1_9TELE